MRHHVYVTPHIIIGSTAHVDFCVRLTVVLENKGRYESQQGKDKGRASPAEIWKSQNRLRLDPRQDHILNRAVCESVQIPPQLSRLFQLLVVH